MQALLPRCAAQQQVASGQSTRPPSRCIAAAARPKPWRRCSLGGEAQRNPRAPTTRTHAAATPDAQTDLAEQLLQAEADLQALFEGGGEPPAAGTVMKYRQQVAGLRAQLKELAARSLPAGAGDALAEASAASAVSGVLTGRAAPLLQKGEDTVEGRLKAVGVDVLVLTIQERAVAEALAAQNALLRRKARALLERQMELSSLLSEHVASLKAPQRQQQLYSSAAAGTRQGLTADELLTEAAGNVAQMASAGEGVEQMLSS